MKKKKKKSKPNNLSKPYETKTKSNPSNPYETKTKSNPSNGSTHQMQIKPITNHNLPQHHRVPISNPLSINPLNPPPSFKIKKLKHQIFIRSNSMGERERKLHLVHIEKREREREREWFRSRDHAPHLFFQLVLGTPSHWASKTQMTFHFSVLKKLKIFFFFLMLKFLCGYWERSEKKQKKKQKQKQNKKNKTKQNENATILLAKTIVVSAPKNQLAFKIICYNIFSFQFLTK